MAVWYLILWNVVVPPFEAGQYQSRERCLAGAHSQYIPLTKVYGHLYWKCEVRMVIGFKEGVIPAIKSPFSPHLLANT
jgi:hypothetical protein